MFRLDAIAIYNNINYMYINTTYKQQNSYRTTNTICSIYINNKCSFYINDTFRVNLYCYWWKL